MVKEENKNNKRVDRPGMITAGGKTRNFISLINENSTGSKAFQVTTIALPNTGGGNKQRIVPDSKLYNI